MYKVTNLTAQTLTISGTTIPSYSSKTFDSFKNFCELNRLINRNQISVVLENLKATEKPISKDTVTESMVDIEPIISEQTEVKPEPVKTVSRRKTTKDSGLFDNNNNINMKGEMDDASDIN